MMPGQGLSERISIWIRMPPSPVRRMPRQGSLSDGSAGAHSQPLSIVSGSPADLLNPPRGRKPWRRATSPTILLTWISMETMSASPSPLTMIRPRWLKLHAVITGSTSRTATRHGQGRIMAVVNPRTQDMHTMAEKPSPNPARSPECPPRRSLPAMALVDILPTPLEHVGAVGRVRVVVVGSAET